MEITVDHCQQGLVALAHPGRQSNTARWIEDIQAHGLMTHWRALDDDASWATLMAWLPAQPVDVLTRRFHPIWQPVEPTLIAMSRCLEQIWLDQMDDARLALDRLHEYEHLDVLCMYAEMLWTIYSDDPSLRASMLTGQSPWPVPRYTTTFDVWYNRAMIAIDAGQRDDASTLLRRTLSLRPGLTEAWHQLAAITDNPSRRQFALEQARWGYALGVEHQSDDPFWWYWSASALTMMGRWPQALRHLEQAIERQPDYAIEARDEPDFEPLFDHPDFVAMTTLEQK